MAHSGKSSPDQDRVISLIVDFLSSTPITEFQREFPDYRNDLFAWAYYNCNWIEDGQAVGQSVIMLDATAQHFITLQETLFEILSKRKNGTQIPEKVVSEVVSECIARYVWHYTNGSISEADSLVTIFINATLLASPHPFQVTVPVFGLQIDSPVIFRGIRYSRPKDCPEYVERMNRLIRDGINDPDNPLSKDINDGSHALAFVQCEARFEGEALNIANTLVSRDLAIIKYAVNRDSRHGNRLAMPGVTNWQRLEGSLSKIVFSSRGSSTTHIPGFPGVATHPVVMSDWQQSKWFDALESLVILTEQDGRRMAHQVCDALVWLGRSTSEADDTTRLLYQITALETLLPIEGKEEKAQQVRLLTSLLGGMAGMNKQRTFDLVQRAYSTRSEIVHGSTLSISSFEPVRMERILDKIIDYLLFTSFGKAILGLKCTEFNKDLYRLILRE